MSRGSPKPPVGVYRDVVDPPELSRAVDEVLEAAWPRERRRAILHRARPTLGWVVIFFLAFLVGSLVAQLMLAVVVH